MTTPYRSSGLACPHCPGASLREFQRRYVCDECQGILIPFDDLMSAIEDVSNTTQKLAYRDERATETPCPVCMRALTACRVEVSSDDRKHKLRPELLRCDRDGLWFPKDALVEILAKVGRRWGGGGGAHKVASIKSTGLDGLPIRSAGGAATGGLRISHWHERGRRRAPTLTPVNAYADRRLVCPVCPDIALVFQGDRWVCTGCLGAFLQDAALTGLINEMTDVGWELPPPTGSPGARGCPVCAQPMSVETGEVTLDRCAGHGIWFDAGELASSLEHAGGLHEQGIGTWIKRLFFS